MRGYFIESPYLSAWSGNWKRVALGQPILDSALECRVVTGSVEVSCLHSVVI